MAAFDPAAFLPDELLASIRDRAADVDRRNVFPQEDLDDLREAGYLRILVPVERGGAGLGLAAATVLQQRLAEAAPATALAVNMHLVWTGVARVLGERGVPGLDFVQDGAAAGEVFAFGISEAGNDLVLFDSGTEAVPQEDGGYAFTGTKVFTSLAPVWTRLGLHGLDTTSPDAPKLVFAFLDRSDAVVTEDDWDTLGMRGTQSRTTRLHGAVAPPDRVVRRIDPGPSADPLIFGIFAVFELLLASVYTGMARRALDLAVESARTRRSRRTGETLDQDPDIRHRIAAMGLAYDALPPQIAALAEHVDARVDHGSRWFTLLSGVKHRATETARRVVTEAMLASGGGSYFSSAELSRLSRDVLAGAFHPSDPESAHSTAAAYWLGPLR